MTVQAIDLSLNKKYKDEDFGGSETSEILITPCLNGWVVEVGGEQYVFTDKPSLLSFLKETL